MDYSMENKGKPPRCTRDVGTFGTYAIWLRSRMNDKQEGFVCHGVLANRGYIENPKMFYCPSNTNETLKYGMQSPSWFSGGRGGGWPKGDIPDDVPEGQSWVQSTYQYRSLRDDNTWRAPSLNYDNESYAVMADVFADPRRGVDFHHREGYNTVYVDGHAAFVMDHNFEIRDYNGGVTYHSGASNHILQDEVWRKYFDNH